MVVQKSVKTGFLDNFFVFIKRFVYSFLYNHYAFEHNHYKINMNHSNNYLEHYETNYNHYEIERNHYFSHWMGKNEESI